VLGLERASKGTTEKVEKKGYKRRKRGKLEQGEREGASLQGM